MAAPGLNTILASFQYCDRRSRVTEMKNAVLLHDGMMLAVRTRALRVSVTRNHPDTGYRIGFVYCTQEHGNRYVANIPIDSCVHRHEIFIGHGLLPTVRGMKGL